jgi:molybdate transport system substrate-binding protein
MRLKIITNVAILTLAAVLQGCSSAAVLPWSDQPVGIFSQDVPIKDGHQPTDKATKENLVDLDVFAAASLTEPFREIGAAFEAAHPEVNLVFNFAGSQQLAYQLEQGAPADIFASANERQMEVVIQAGLITPGTEQPFANNLLAIAVPIDNPADIHTYQDLARQDLLLVMADESAPAGRYSLEFLDKAAQENELGEVYKDNVLENVVSYEANVKAVLNKVALGEADAGIVYISDLSVENTDRITLVEIPEALNSLATYPIAVLKGSPNADLAAAFIEFARSQEGQAILLKHGFKPPNNE